MVKKGHSRVLFVLFFLAIWEAIVQFGIYNEALLPSTFEIIRFLVEDIANGKLILAILFSFRSIFIGLLISLMLCLCLVLIGRINRTLDDLVDFMITIAHPLPGIALLPLIILWIGIGNAATIFVIVHSMLWPLLINMKVEIRNVEQKYLKISHVFNFTWFKTMTSIYLMGSVPALVSGCKIAWSRGWRAFISTEMVFGIVGTNSGLGWYIFEQRVYMNSPGLYSGILAIVLCGILVENMVFSPLEHTMEKRWSS